MKTIRIEVTQQHVNEGMAHIETTWGCPVALALRQATGSGWLVGRRSASRERLRVRTAQGYYESIAETLSLPDYVSEFIETLLTRSRCYVLDSAPLPPLPLVFFLECQDDGTPWKFLLQPKIVEVLPHELLNGL